MDDLLLPKNLDQKGLEDVIGGFVDRLEERFGEPRWKRFISLNDGKYCITGRDFEKPDSYNGEIDLDQRYDHISYRNFFITIKYSPETEGYRTKIVMEGDMSEDVAEVIDEYFPTVSFK